jgi:hypothetical protein
VLTEQFSHDTRYGPYIYRPAVMLRTQQELWWSVPSRRYVLCKWYGVPVGISFTECYRSCESEIAKFEQTRSADKNIFRFDICGLEKENVWTSAKENVTKMSISVTTHQKSPQSSLFELQLISFLFFSLAIASNMLLDTSVNHIMIMTINDPFGQLINVMLHCMTRKAGRKFF